MKRKEILLGLLIIFALLGLFFNQTFLHGRIPFPGDLLTAEYQPWKSESYLGYNPGSIPNKAQYPDTIRQLYPWRTLETNIFKSKQMPLWNPYNFSGTPLLANFQSAVFYPLSWLSLILPPVWSWTIMMILEPLLTLIFTYFYCRKIKLSFEAAWLAAITFSFCAFSTVWLEYNTIGQVIVWLPLILLAVENLKERFNLSWAVIISFSIAFSLLAGHPQVFAYLFVFSLIYAWYRFGNPKNFFKFLIFAILGVGLAGIQLIPGLELILQAARSPHTINLYLQKILIQPWQVIMALVPDFFGNPATRNYWPLDTYIGKVTAVGIVGLILALISVKFFKKDGLVRLFSLTALCVFILITANPLTILLYRFPLPFISSSSPTLMTFLFTFSLSILSAFGFDNLQKGKINPKTVVYWLGTLLVVFIILWLSVILIPKMVNADWATKLAAGKRVLLQQTIIFGATAILLLMVVYKRKSKSIISLLIVLQVFELFLGFKKFNPFVPKELVFPDATVFSFLKNQNSIDRFWGYGAASIEANFATQYSLFSPDGYDPLYPKRYGEFIQSSEDGRIHTDFTDQTRSDAVIAPGDSDADLNNNLYRLRVLDLLGVKFILDRTENGSSEKRFTTSRFQPVWQKAGWTVFQNLKAAPRFFLSSNFETFTDNRDFETKFFSPTFNPEKTVLLEKTLPIKLTANSPIDTVRLINYSPDEVSFQTHSSGPKLLFLSDTDYPGWRAYVDNNPTEILRADYTFRAVIVPAGDHTIRFIFRPKSFTIGVVISLISLAILLMTFVMARPFRLAAISYLFEIAEPVPSHTRDLSSQ